MPLPTPRRAGGRGVMDAFGSRRSRRMIAATPLSADILSELLWAAAGAFRQAAQLAAPDGVPAPAKGPDEIEIYVLREDGVSLFQREGHLLRPLGSADSRALASLPGDASASLAPVTFVFAADLAAAAAPNWKERSPPDPQAVQSRLFADAGQVAGYVHLYASANFLAAWAHDCDRAQLAKALNLRDGQAVLFAMSLGYPLYG